MSITSIPNQPIIFRSQEEVLTPCIECGDSNYKQLIDFNDKVFFQLESTACEQFPMLPFETDFQYWTFIDGEICSDGASGYYIQDLYVDYNYTLYSITFKVLNIDEGTLNVKMFGSSTYEITLAGTYTLYFNNPTLYNGVYVKINFFGSGFIGCIDAPSILVKGIASKNELKIGIVDAITLEQFDVITPVYSVIDNKIIGSFDFINIDVSEGCYRLAFADFCENTCSQFRIANTLFNQFFNIPYGWSAVTAFGANYTFTQNSFCAETPFEDGEITLTSASELCEGKYYYISIIVESTSNHFIYAQVGNNSVQFPYNATGYLTIGITAGSPSIESGMKLNFFIQNNGSGAGSTCIKRVDVQIDDSNIQWNKYSDIIDLGDYSDPCKYFKIEGCNSQEQFNLAFNGNQFMPMVRLEGRRGKPQYETNANTFRYASGKWNANYVNRLKQWTYSFGRLPEYMLDFLSTIFYYDNCYVNGVLMFPQEKDFPTIEWNDADTFLGSFNIDLIEKNNKVVKVQCSDSNATCLPSVVEIDGPYLLSEDGNILVTEDSVNLYYEF